MLLKFKKQYHFPRKIAIFVFKNFDREEIGWKGAFWINDVFNRSDTSALQ